MGGENRPCTDKNRVSKIVQQKKKRRAKLCKDHTRGVAWVIPKDEGEEKEKEEGTVIREQKGKIDFPRTHLHALPSYQL
jgi:hypothetical protein